MNNLIAVKKGKKLTLYGPCQSGSLVVYQVVRDNGAFILEFNTKKEALKYIRATGEN